MSTTATHQGWLAGSGRRIVATGGDSADRRQRYTAPSRKWDALRERMLAMKLNRKTLPWRPGPKW